MARRKAYLDDDGDSSDGSGSEGEGYQLDDPDLRDEADLFKNPYGGGSKKRKRRGKEDAIYGIFGDEDEENEKDGGVGRTVRGRDIKGKKVDYTAGQAFVPASAKASSSRDKSIEEDQDSASNGVKSESSSDSEELPESEALARKPVTEEEELETRSTFGGIGSKGPTSEEVSMRKQGGNGFNKPASFVSSRRGLGSSATAESTPERSGSETPVRGGIGSNKGTTDSSQHPSFQPSTLAGDGVPSAFGAARPSFAQGSTSFQNRSGGRPSFVSSGSASSTPSKKPTGKSGGGFDAAAMLAKMGWSQGQGLGKSGEGIVNPIETKLRPQNAGIAFGGFKEKTKQAKEEARRRGEEVSSDEEDRARMKRKPKTAEGKKEPKPVDHSEAWRRTEKKPRKPKVEHRTYEQIIEEAGGVPSTDAGVGQIIDATGKELREVTSLASALASHATPTSDTTRLPELRHNLRLICDNNKQSLDALAKEGASIFDRRRWLKREVDESRRRREKEELDITRLRQVLGIVQELGAAATQASAKPPALELFSPLVERLVLDFAPEIESHGLDEALVGAIAPTMRRLMVDWEPLQDPTAFTGVLKRWRKALRIADAAEPDLQLNIYGQHDASRTRSRQSAKTVMSPYDSLLWNVWMPKIRSAINNEWKPSHPRAAVALLEAWNALLPRFVLDNITDQLLLPKIRGAVADWDPRRSKTPLHNIIFPWLPLLGDRMTDLLSDARRRLKGMLQAWKVIDGVPQYLSEWKDVFSTSDWDSMLLSKVVPKLGASLRDDFRVDPRSQNMEPLERVLSWRKMLRTSVYSRLLETEFFPKWLEVLYLWLSQSSANYDEIAQWYSFWKGWFPKDTLEMPGITKGFERGLDLINQAIALGSDKSRLQRPDTTPMSRSAHALASASSSKSTRSGGLNGGPGPTSSSGPEVTFRSIVEEAAAESDLLVLPLNRSHEQTGLPLFRVSKNVDGKGGVNVYLQEDVVWAEVRGGGAGEFEPVGLQDMVSRVKGN